MTPRDRVRRSGVTGFDARRSVERELSNVQCDRVRRSRDGFGRDRVRRSVERELSDVQRDRVRRSELGFGLRSWLQ